jgi:hypothetical protein
MPCFPTAQAEHEENPKEQDAIGKVTKVTLRVSNAGLPAWS